MAYYTPALTSGQLDKRQATQDLPFWLSASYTTMANPTDPDGPPVTTVAIVNLPLTYYGPSIPLGSGWVWGGDANPASIYIPPTATETEDMPTTTPGPTTAAPTTRATPTASPTSATLPTETGMTDSGIQSSVSGAGPTTISQSAPMTTASGTSSISSISSISSMSESLSASLSATETPTSALPSTSSSVTPAAFPPEGKHLALPTGAIVGIVVGGLFALILCCILGACFFRRRDHRSSYRRSDPRDPEVQAGVAEQSSLLSGRLAGGESPPIGSPTMPGAVLRSGRRTPLSTRRPQYEAVPTNLGSHETAEANADTAPEASEAIEPSRASTDEVHRRSANGYTALAVGTAAGAAAGAVTARSRTGPPPEIRTSNLQSSSSGSTSPRSRLGSVITPITGSFLNFFGRRSRRQEQLGDGWEEVVPPTRQQAMGLGMTRPPTPPRHTDSPLQPFPPNSLGSSRPSERASELVERLNSTYTTHDRPPSFASGHSEYVDARSRPQTPGSGLVAGAAAAAAGEQEMSERNVGLVSRRSEPPVPPLPLQGYQPISAIPPQLRSSLHTTGTAGTAGTAGTGGTTGSGNPFENSAYLADQLAYDDALDSLPPVGLLPPVAAAVGAATQRDRWTRSVIEEEDEAGEALLGGALDDEPPAPAGSFSRATGEQVLTVPPIDRSLLYTPSLHASGLESPRMGQEERDITAESIDETGGRPWSGQVVRAESISLGQRVPSTRPIWTQSLATHTTGPSPIATTSQQPFPGPGVPLMPAPPARAAAGARVSRASRGSREWTTQLDTPGSAADDYRAIVAWFEQNPTPNTGRGGSLVVPADTQQQEPSDESSSLGRTRSDAETDRRRLSVPREGDIQPPRPYSS
ncbi:hypothetical protein FS837_009176 [Tulasnella sp. UAMH 9824]|nr:hypothetical protein FS837_009176 [Tulasnella sp. UAMH 9824]